MSAPAGALSIFPHCRSIAWSRRSPVFISPLPQQCLLPQEPCLYFPTAAAVPAPAGALSIFPHCRSTVCSRRSPVYISPLPQHCLLPQEPCLYFPTAAAMPAPAGALSIFPHCRSTVCSRRSPVYISPLPQHCLLPQEPCLYFPTAVAVSTRFRRSHFLYSDAAAVPASTGALSIFPQCRSSVYSRRSLLCISTLSSTRFRRSRFSPFRCCNGAVTTSDLQHPFSSNQCKLGGYQAPLWLLSHDNSILGEYSGSRLSAELGPLSPDREVPWTARQIRITFTQFIIYMCEFVEIFMLLNCSFCFQSLST